MRFQGAANIRVNNELIHVLSGLEFLAMVGLLISLVACFFGLRGLRISQILRLLKGNR